MNTPATTLLTGLLTLFGAAWLHTFLATSFPENAAALWIARQHGMYLTGILSMVLMSLVMLLSTRPTWLEAPLGGMDRIYRLHKWAGIFAVVLGAAHWGLKESFPIIKGLIGMAGRLPRIRPDGLLATLRKPAEGMGEWALYLLLAMIVITLWRRFPYNLWRHVHRLMPVFYLMLVFHSIVLTPTHYWRAPIGILLGIVLAAGTWASLLSMSGRIGRNRRSHGKIVAVHTTDGVTEVTCHLDERWPGHQPGQFAFLSFDRIEGHHPFTIASASDDQRTITFCIKALGKFTRRLRHTAHVGQHVVVEGPYGHFRLDRHDPSRRQIWVAGGIGVTPFLSWLASLQSTPEDAPQAELHYCTRDRQSDPFVTRLAQLCATLPNIRLHVHGAQQGQRLDAAGLHLDADGARQSEVWFCGPTGLADSLKKGFRASGHAPVHFHQEAFEMR